jgi:hypothetical protein
MGDPVVVKWMLLKIYLKKWDKRVWTGYIWVRVRSIGGIL